VFSLGLSVAEVDFRCWTGWAGITLGVRFPELLILEASDEGQRSKTGPSWTRPGCSVASLVAETLQAAARRGVLRFSITPVHVSLN